MGLWLRLRDGLALLIALGAAVAGVVAWYDGSVHIGLEIEAVDAANAVELGFEPDIDKVVVVSAVVPDGNAVRYGIHPGMVVTDLWTTDGSEVERSDQRFVTDFGDWVHLPQEAVSSERLAGVAVGSVWEEDGGPLYVSPLSQVDRPSLEGRLRTDVYLPLLGLGAGILVWGLLRRGLAGRFGRQEAVTAGCAVATPFLLAPVVDVGNPIGIVLAYAGPIALAMLIGFGLAVTHPEPMYRQIGTAATLAATTVAAFLVGQHVLTPMLSPDERGTLFAAIGVVPLAPAAVASLSPERSTHDRLTLLSTSLVPFAALTLILPSHYIPPLPLLLVAGLIGWHLVPWRRVGTSLGDAFDRIRSGANTVADTKLGASAVRERRDMVTAALAGMTVLLAVASDANSGWALLLAALAAAGIGLAIRQGVLGAEWTDAAVPVAAAVAVPILLVPVTWGYYALYPPVLLPAALAALSVAHLLAQRHTEPRLRRRLIGISALVALVAVITGSDSAFAVALLGVICLVPAIPVAFTERPDAEAISWRLETLAVALTPAAAATVLLPGGAGILVLGGWLAIVVVWRYLAILPLVGLANRTQLQRDLAVAAAETERARLAADLHDDALQQLTMLVRTLDDSGESAAASEAREIAAKLRAVVGDLRLPLLDDLGAGAALEWLVERVEPLAGGRVTLERSDLVRPPADVELAIFRVAQEALTNAIKHGRAPIAVRYDVRADGRVSLAIDDAGAGIEKGASEEAPREGHFGLSNMQQRAEQIGALLDVRPWPTGGTRVALDWRPG